MAATQDNMTCAVCTEVYRSPRFLPCYHTFCLECLEELAKRHGDTIPCPTCRAPATVPPGGVCDLQVNFYFTEEALEQARSEKRQSMCPVHNKEVAVLHCTQCDQAICLKCKLTKHEGYATEELSDTIARCKKTIENKLHTFEHTIQSKKHKLESCKQNEKRAQEKRAAVMEQVGQSSTQIETLSSACDTEVLDVEREMRRREIGDTPLRDRRSVHSTQTYRPVLHGDFHNYIEDHYMKTFIGSPVKQSFSNKKTVDIVRLCTCLEGRCQEVHALRQQENGNIDVYYGGTGGDYSTEKRVSFNSDGSIITETEYGMRISCISRRSNVWAWKYPTSCYLGSKNTSMHSLMQNFATGEFYMCSMKWKQTDGEEDCVTDTALIYPKVHKAHNFDSNEQGTFFAVVEEEADDEPTKTDNNKADSRVSRVVRLYSNKSDHPITTYKKNNMFPTDVLFCGEDLLLIADWMNDCVHVTQISDGGIEFVCYLHGSGEMVRPTALNLDLNGQPLIGCGDGWILKIQVDDWKALACNWMRRVTY